MTNTYEFLRPMVEKAVQKTAIDYYVLWVRGLREEILQHTYNACLANFAKVTAADNTQAYINSIAKNHAIDLSKRSSNSKTLDFDPTDKRQTKADDREKEKLEEDGREQLVRVNSLIARHYPTALVPMRIMAACLETGSVKAAAQLLGKSVGYIKGNRHRYKRQARVVHLMDGSYARQLEWETVNNVIKDHRELVDEIGFRGTVEFMKITALTLQNAIRNNNGLRRYVIYESAFAKILQMCGWHDDAGDCLKRIEKFGSAEVLKNKIGTGPIEAYKSIFFRLCQPSYGAPACSHHLVQASASMTITENRVRPLWRLGVNATIRGNEIKVADLVERYLESAGELLVPKSNAALVNSLSSLSSGRLDDALAFSASCLESQLRIFDDKNIPEPSIQGLLAAFALDCNLRIEASREGDHRNELIALASDIHLFQKAVGLREKANGLLEIAAVFDAVLPRWRQWRIRSVGRKTRRRKGNMRDFNELIKRYRSVVQD